ncbi:TIGR01777 family protein, partial [Pseudomonas sp. FW300-E2]
LYALLFLLLGWLEVYGLLAMLVVAVLVAEVVITLMDFVEEDLSRKLPPSERINHTLLAINYGAILVLLLPVLIDWAMRPFGVSVVYQ